MAADIREKIIAEALHEINRRGADFHMDDLARNLRISKRTLYEHFSSKQEIIEKSMLSLIDDIHEQHVALLANTEMTTEEKNHKLLQRKDALYLCPFRSQDR